MIRPNTSTVLKCLLAWSLGNVTLSGQTQSAGNYLFRSSTTIYVPISGGNQLFGTNQFNSVSPATEIGFVFNFASTSYSQFQVSTNGFVWLGSGAVDNPTNDLSGSTKPILAPLWDNLRTGATNGRIAYELTGNPSNRLLKIEFRAMRWDLFSPSENANFQVWLYETSNVIRFIYGGFGNQNNSGTGGASIGIVDATNSSTRFLSVTPAAIPNTSSISANNSIVSSSFLLSGTVYEFAPQQLNDVAVTQLNVPPIRPHASFSPQATFRNVGLTNQVNIPVRCEIMNSLNSVLYSSNQTITALSTLASYTVTFDALSSGLPSGDYTLRVTNLLIGDDNRSNDIIIQKIPVNWIQAPAMVYGRIFHTTTVLQDGRVLVAGGRTTPGSGSETAICEIFDPADNNGIGSWKPTASMATARGFHTATLLKDGRVLITGGHAPSYGLLASCEIFDPLADGGLGSWKTITPMAKARAEHTATLLQDGRVLITAGEGTWGACEIFDPSANNGVGSWTTTASISDRYKHSATLLPNGKVLVAGGDGTNTSMIFDMSGNGGLGIWIQAASMLDALFNHAATILPDGRVLVTGGKRYGVSGSTNSCEIFDLSADSTIGNWRQVAPMAINRSYHSTSRLPNGQILVTGNEGVDPTCEIFDPRGNAGEGAWTSAASLAMGGGLSTSCILRDGRILVVGGYFGFSNTKTPEIYDPVSNPTLALPTKLAIVNIWPTSPPAGRPFFVIVEAHDARGVPQNVNTVTVISLSTNTGVGTLSGSVEGTIGEGQNRVILSAVIYSAAEPNVQLKASIKSGMILEAGLSQPFSVVAPLQAPTLTLPVESARNVPLTPTLNWNPSVGATSYHLQLSLAPTFTTILVEDSAIMTASKTIGPLSLATTYYWRVRAKNTGGYSAFSAARQFSTILTTSVEQLSVELPTEFALSQNYPNPFNPTTTVRFFLPFPSSVRLCLYDLQGKQIAVLDEGFRNAGVQSVLLTLSDLNSGAYFYQLSVRGFNQTKRMLLLK